MFELRQFHLQLALSRARALREDVQNERRPIEDLALENLFEVARLRAAQFIIEDDGITNSRRPRAALSLARYAKS